MIDALVGSSYAAVRPVGSCLSDWLQGLFCPEIWGESVYLQFLQGPSHIFYIWDGDTLES